MRMAGSHPPWLLLVPGLQAVVLLRTGTVASICTIPIMALRSLTLQQEKCIAAGTGLHPKFPYKLRLDEATWLATRGWWSHSGKVSLMPASDVSTVAAQQSGTV